MPMSFDRRQMGGGDISRNKNNKCDTNELWAYQIKSSWCGRLVAGDYSNTLDIIYTEILDVICTYSNTVEGQLATYD
jgi:hypothetical protein